uniref:Teneurin N-terminal domain-containing protein n=1 Tax=Hucho hucho TaxID=62062 RepID=A0A4W5MCL6_9TELE
MYCTTSPGYPLTSSTVYSPPPRPLPRNTFSRPAFSLKKPYKHCNWKCAALSAILTSVTLVFLLAYFIAMHLLGLNWHLQPMQGQMYQLSEDNTSGLPLPTDLSLPPLGNTGLELPDRRAKDDGKEMQLTYTNINVTFISLSFSCFNRHMDIQCLRKGFRPHDFFHILLRYS